MKTCFAILPLLLISGMAWAAAPEAARLERHILSGFSYRSVDEAVQIIEQRTGFKVSLPKDISGPLRAFRTDLGCGDDHSEASVTEFLDQICRSLGLGWKFVPQTNTLSLDIAWRRSDPRNPAELLKSLKDYEPRQINFAQVPKQNSPSFGNEKWQDAFDALLSVPQNFEKAWKVRQQSLFEGSLALPMYSRPLMKPLLERRIIAKNLEAYTVIIVDHPIWVYPGNGSVSYYWFHDDGTLVRAGLMNAGHRCQLIDATIAPDLETGSRGAPFKQPSELQMIMKMNLGTFYIARYVLGAAGFELLGVVNASGVPLDANGLDGMHFGESLIEEPNH